MKYRLLGALALFLFWASVVFAEPVTIAFDDTDTLTYAVSGFSMDTEYGCSAANPCLVATGSRGAVGQRVTITVSFPQAVTIRNVQVDYRIRVDGTPSSYTGGVWDLEVKHNGRWQFSGTVGTRLATDSAWHTTTTQDNNVWARYWQANDPYTGDSLRIQFRPVARYHDGAEIWIDNVVIDYDG